MSKNKGSYARAVGRVLGRYGMKNRYVRGGMSAADTTLRATARTGRILWLEIMGLICLIFAVSLAGALWQQYQRRATIDHAEIRLAGGGVVLAIFCWFAVSSFWRARRLKRN